jgi:cephalosporin hydroxylase
LKNSEYDIVLAHLQKIHSINNVNQNLRLIARLNANQTYMVQEQKIVDGDARKAQPSQDTPAVL